MPRKMLDWLESKYLTALTYAGLYKCQISVEQFASCERLDPDEYEELKQRLEAKGIGA